MKLQMNFSFDTEETGDEKMMQKVCAVLAGADAKTVTAEAAPLKAAPLVIPKEAIEKLVEKIKEETAPAPAPTKEEAPAETEAASDVNVIDVLNSTEEDMMKMSSDTLLKALKSIKVDPNKTEGKNTNKKLRDLILDWRKSKAPTEDEAEEDDEAPAATPAATTLEPMGLVEARTAIEPFFNTADRKAIVQKLMIEHGAKKVNAAGQTVCSLGVLDAEGKDYRPLVSAIVNYPYAK